MVPRHTRRSVFRTAIALPWPVRRLLALRRPPAWREPGQTKDAEFLASARLRYTAEGREIVGRDAGSLNNRPLYCQPQTPGVVLAGDRPFLRLIGPKSHLGFFAIGVVRGGAGRWLHECEPVESRYRCGRMRWLLPEMGITLSAVPTDGACGLAVRLEARGVQPGTELVWVFGGAVAQTNVRWRWDPTMRGNPAVYKLGDPRKPEADLALTPEWCRGNQPRVEGAVFHLDPVGGTASRGGARLADASALGDPARVAASGAGALPLVCGVAPLQAGSDEIYWTAQAGGGELNPRQAFERGEAYLRTVERVEVETPDARLDAAIAAVCHPIDAAFDRTPARFLHGCMAFNIGFLGWRVISGATALGWHDRVRATAEHYLPQQIQDAPERTAAQADPRRLGCIEGPESRFWGRGRLAPDRHHMYDTQTQFFDQLIREWRSTGDAALERILRPALEPHLEWARECFDPDDDGLYESYINTLPTDSVWYNGGGSVEESAYICYAHMAARDMARRAGDESSAERHQRRAEKIRAAVNEHLWLEDRGHYGLYREQGGHRRVHADSWTYSQFLPIDAGMATREQATRALQFTEWGLERIRLPYGGEICQPSNWVPWKWSVRDVFGGDVCALALAYFQTGLAEGGWRLLLGAMLESAYASGVPGGFSHIGAGTDFSDNTHMFARTAVEGLFGYAPDYPAGVVRFRPAFPGEWEHAAIRTPDFTLDFSRRGGTERFVVTLAQPARIEFRISGAAARDTGGRVLDKATFAFHGVKRPAEVRAARPPVPLERVPKPVVVTGGARWETISLAAHHNGDVRAIFGQRYRSPRPATCSVRLGEDGYSAWTFPFWGEKPPVIEIGNVDPLGSIRTAQGVPFDGLGAARNIAFTSLWDNWPDAVTIPAGRSAEAVWLLVCGTTFPMQTRIANAEVRFHYADGNTETLALIPPLNFWSLCPWGGMDYDARLDAFCLPAEPPPQVQLGRNCRAMVLSWRLRSGTRLESITLETLSEDVVVGLMAMSLMNPSA
jgi:hypothetical protein